jgi:hypothetical protein
MASSAANADKGTIRMARNAADLTIRYMGVRDVVMFLS